jgi:hypothetical protein
MHRICDCPSRSTRNSLRRSRAKPRMAISSTYIFTVIVEEGLERLGDTFTKTLCIEKSCVPEPETGSRASYDIHDTRKIG